MMKLTMFYVGGEEGIEVAEVFSYTLMQGWLVVYFADDSIALYPSDRIEQVGVEIEAAL